MDVKNPITFKEQVEKLKSKGFIIDDDVECEKFLQRVNYYRFSAYFLPYKNTDDTYKSGIKLSNVIKVYDFDIRLHTFLQSIIEEIEVHIKTQVAYNHAHKYGALGYLYSSSFIQGKKHNHTLFEQKIDGLIKMHDSTLVMQHHINKYGGKFPLWVIIEFFSISMVSYFYSDMRTTDKKQVAKKFNASCEMIESWLKCITELRNRCAHYGRVYYWKFKSIPKFPKNSNHTITDKLFDQVLMLKYFYCDQNKWNNYFLPQLSALIEEYKEYIDLQHISFPEDWEAILMK